jgi:hypothetical protein
MTGSPTGSDAFLTIGKRIRVMPILHGSGDFAIAAREELLARPYDCLAVPLPASLQDPVEQAIDALPVVSAVVQQDPDGEFCSYVPIDPCQGVIAALRSALGERIPRAFIDLETPKFEATSQIFPDPFALKRVRLEAFAAALLPSIPRPAPGQHTERIAWMADQLHDLERDHRLILFVCSALDWPWIRQAYQERWPTADPEPRYTPVRSFRVDPATLAFFLGELPFITALYERARGELLGDEHLSIDGVKELLVATRERLRRDQPRLGERLSPHLLATMLKYTRNLCLMDHRLTPDLYTLAIAAKQTAGDDFALALVKLAREYLPPALPGAAPESLSPHDAAGTGDIAAGSGDEPGDVPDWWAESGEGLLRMGLGQADLPEWGVLPMVNRLPGQPMTWRTIDLKPRPPAPQRRRWKQRWDPYGVCSWPPEDDRIESFHRHVRDAARATLGADLARSEKFTTSVRDGIDLRETLRNWHTGDLYVKVIPPDRGSIETVVFLFDSPANPDLYPHRTTWFAEHAEESTLAFFATDPFQDLVGPGIARARYGGALFLYPPRMIPDIWTDPRLRFANTLEERLIAGACIHSRERHVAVVSAGLPRAAWRRIARRFGRRIVHLPLKRFSGSLIERLRTFHVLNGRKVRSYAADFIRDLE